MINDPIRNNTDSIGPYDGRIGSSPELERGQPRGGKRVRQRIPTLEQLRALLNNGVITLPSRYFRGYFLDVTI